MATPKATGGAFGKPAHQRIDRPTWTWTAPDGSKIIYYDGKGD